jgi:hypothetical protein
MVNIATVPITIKATARINSLLRYLSILILPFSIIKIAHCLAVNLSPPGSLRSDIHMKKPPLRIDPNPTILEGWNH